MEASNDVKPRTVGRGRGRGFHAILKKQDLDQPVGGQSTTQQLTNMLQSLSVASDDKELRPAKDNIRRLVNGKLDAQHTVTELFSLCEADWRFSQNAVTIVNDLQDVLRTEFLYLIQQRYKNMGKLQLHEWLALVAVLCQSVVIVRLRDGSLLDILFEPCLKVLIRCLRLATDDDLECASIQLLDVAGILHSGANADLVKELHSLIKTCICNGSGSKQTRLRLIQILEGTQH